jgi:hypothetical protein
MIWNVRRTRRAASELLGRIHAGTGAPTRCGVDDLSPEGASLRVSAPLPPEFELEIGETGERRRVSLRWKAEDRAGVAFIPLPEAG